MFKLTFWGRPKDVTLQVSLWDIFPKPKEYAMTKFLESNTHIWWSKTENITAEIRFVLMLKIGVLGKSQDRHPLDVTLEPL